jgi:arylsulfatase A-like enzyme
MKKNKFEIIWILASAASIFFTFKVDNASAYQIEKVILISIDTLRADYLGCYNPKMKTSPNLDRFASENVIFQDNMAQSATTAASHKSIFYSVYPSVHKTTLHTVAQEKLKSPIEMIRESAFETAAFTGGSQVTDTFGFARGFNSFHAWSGGPPKKDLKQTKQFAFDWLEKHYDKKFFLFLHTFETHCPYNPPTQFFKKWSGWYGGRVEKGKCLPPFLMSQMQTSEIDFEFVRSLYSAEVNYVDEFMGELFHKLKDLSIYDKTLIIFLSDHGESLGERGYIGHSQLYNVQLQVPLIMHIPGIMATRIRTPIELVDVMPTILELVGVKNTSFALQGSSLLSLIQNPRIYKERPRISEEIGRVRVQSGDLALNFTPGKNGDEELYDLKNDPLEFENLALEKPEIVKTLKLPYYKMISTSRNLSAQFIRRRLNNSVMTKETIEQLKALGYIAQ